MTASTSAVPSQTATGNSAQIQVASGSTIQVFCNPKLGSAETVTVERTPDDGSTWLPVNDPKYGGRFLGGDITSNSLTGPGEFRLVKSATVVATQVWYDV